MKCVVIPGDGIGPEVVSATLRVLDKAGAGFEWVHADAGLEAAAKAPPPKTLDLSQAALPQETIDLCAQIGVTLKGPTTTPIGVGVPSANVALRKKLDLYANVRPVKSVPHVPSRFSDVDLVVVRENTEDLYAGIEHVVVPGVVESLKIITHKASTRIARFAYEYARSHHRKMVHVVHKANIMKLSDGLFLDCCRAVAKDYPEIVTKEVIVDALCMQLVKDPRVFDVMVMENLYGDIVSDLCAGLVGGLGVVPGANLGERCAVFEAVHGSAPDITGKGLANPTALLMSSILMLEHVGKTGIARRVEAALLKVYSEGRWLTTDLGGQATTGEFTQAVIDSMDA